MAGKKHRARNGNKTFKSKGERRSSIPTSGYGVTNAERMLNKLDALKKGKDVWMTIDNPNKNETNKRQIRVKVNGVEWKRRREGKII